MAFFLEFSLSFNPLDAAGGACEEPFGWLALLGSSKSISLSMLYYFLLFLTTLLELTFCNS